MEFEVGRQYTRAQVQDALNVPEDQRDGDWLTGYTRFNDELFVFCNVGTAGRTGHDYFRGHLSWHLALAHLEQGDVEEGCRLYTDAFAADQYPGPALVKLLDAPSYLWRAELAGHPR